MGNKKALQIATKELNKAKAPSKPKDIIYDPAGQWKFPGQDTRIPGDNITMQGVPYPVMAYPNIGQPQMMYPGQDYVFPGADYVDEYPQMRKGGGIPKYLKLPKNYGRRQYSNNISATNRLFAKNFLFRKEKNKIYDPNAKYQDGGEQGCPEGYAFNPKTGECVEWNPTIWSSEEQPTSFDPVGDVIYMNPNDRPEGMSDEEYAQLYKDQIEHEQLHRLQWINDELKGFDRTPLRMPSTVDNQQHEGPHYYNRRGEEADYLHNYWKTHHPEEAEFIPDDVIYNSETDPAMYVLPWTVEGEARDYEYATHGGMESLFPKKEAGGESGCPPGTYWNGKSCVKLPKADKDLPTLWFTGGDEEYDKFLKRKAAYDDSAKLYRFTEARLKNAVNKGGKLSVSKKAEDLKFLKEYNEGRKIKADKFYNISYPPGTKDKSYTGTISYPKPKQPVAFKRVDEPEKKKQEPVKENIVIDKLPIKPAYIDQPKKDIIDNSNPVPPKISVKTEPEYSPEYSEEGGPDSIGYHYKDRQKRYIDWNGRAVGYRPLKFRKPGHSGDLIKLGSKKYFYLPTIESRTEGWFEADNDNEEEYQDGGYIELELTPEEIQTYRDGGYIVEDVSIPSLTKASYGYSVGNLIRKQDGGEETDPPADGIAQRVEYAEGQTPEGFAQGMPVYTEVTKKAEAPYWLDVSREYEKKNSKQAFIDKKKRDYLKNTNRGLSKAAGLSMENFPEDVERNFANEYDYKKNTYVAKKLGKKFGFSPRRRGEWVDNLSKGERNVIANSKFESKLQPSYWSRSLAGLQELYGDVYAPGVSSRIPIPGLTKKEQKDIQDSKLGALETLSIWDAPGAYFANLINQTGNTSYGAGYREAPGYLSTEKMSGVTDLHAMALNPLNYTLPYDIPMLGQSLVRGAVNLRNATKAKIIGNLAKEVAEIQPLQRVVGNTGAVAEDIATVAKIPSRGYNPVELPKELPGSLSSGQASKTIYPSGIVETPINKIKVETPKASWTMEDIPGLHLKSTMSDGAVSKIIEPKTGLINVEQALGIIGKESSGANKVELIKQGLGNVIPKKMDYNEFRKVVQEQLIPLERQLVNHSSNFGVASIGYPSAKRSSFEKAIGFAESEVKNLTKTFEEYKLYSENPELYRQSLPPEKQALFTDEQLKEIAKGMRDDYEGRLIAAKDQLNKNLTQMNDLPLENQTLVLGNKEGFGKGSSAHNNPEETLGHIHFLVDKETPDILTVTQMQSDAFQGTHRIMPDSKETLEYSIANMENHLINLQDNYDNAIMIDEYTYELPNGQRIDRDAYSKMVDDQYKIIEDAKNELKMYDQKSLLDKNHQERYLQELVAYAAERGDMNKIRVPTSKTSSKIQGYQEYTIGPETIEQAKTMSLEDFVELKKELKYKNTGVKPKEKDIEFIKKMHKDINNKGVTTYYEPEYQTILKKYDEQPKLIKKLFGEEPKIVTDSKGNTWYEFDIPKKYKQGKGEIKAFKYGGSKNTDEGIVTSLSQKEIQDLIAQGYIVEDVD